MKPQGKKILIIWLVIQACMSGYCAFGQTVRDTTGGYISIENIQTHNPICCYEMLSGEHVVQAKKLKTPRKGLAFYPANLNDDYNNSGDDRGHVISWEDLAYSKQTAYASYNLQRNLAPQPHSQNVGTKYASEQLGRQLAIKWGYVRVYGGVTGSVGNTKGVNEPKYYWTEIITPKDTQCYYMPTTGDKVTKQFLNDPEIHVSVKVLYGYLGFDPTKLIGK